MKWCGVVGWKGGSTAAETHIYPGPAKDIRFVLLFVFFSFLFVVFGWSA